MNDRIRVREVALSYFKYWNNRDLKGLRQILSADASLVDWEIDVSGLQPVLDANEKIFNDVAGIRAEIVSLAIEANLVIAELDIYISDTEILEVVDVLKFTEDYKIKSIKAFKCRQLRTNSLCFID